MITDLSMDVRGLPLPDRVIDLRMLRELNACGEQVQRFYELFGDSVVVTKELCVEHAYDFDFTWFGSKVFQHDNFANYLADAVKVRGRMSDEMQSFYESKDQSEHSNAWDNYKEGIAIAFWEAMERHEN